jgi:hypothetical protein
MKKNKRENLYGIPPDVLEKCRTSNNQNCDSFIIHKSSKKGQSSFRITKSLLDSILLTSSKIQKKPTLIITITDGSNEYIITSSITKI